MELTRVARKLDGDALVRELGFHGIQATMFASDAEGIAPHYAIGQGHRVMVRAKDVARATSALSG